MDDVRIILCLIAGLIFMIVGVAFATLIYIESIDRKAIVPTGIFLMAGIGFICVGICNVVL